MRCKYIMRTSHIYLVPVNENKKNICKTNMRYIRHTNSVILSKSSSTSEMSQLANNQHKSSIADLLAFLYCSRRRQQVAILCVIICFTLVEFILNPTIAYIMYIDIDRIPVEQCQNSQYR